MTLIDRRNNKNFCVHLAWSLTALVTLVLSGCDQSNPLSGQKLYPVKGKVVLPDGKPLTSGQVVFIATKSTVTSTANIDGDGGFTFKSTAGDGLPEGDYKVRLEPAGSSGKAAKGAGGAIKGTVPFPSHYLDEDSSDLKATVTADDSKNNFEFKLGADRPPGQSKK
jgi:hypothetical protein